MVFDGQNRAWAFFRSVCTCGIYDNIRRRSTRYSSARTGSSIRRFLRMCGHFLVEPIACTPASGREEGRVEDEVRLVCGRFFTRDRGWQATRS
jgi:hypothetical protein